MSKEKTCGECGTNFYGRKSSRYCSIICRFWSYFDKSGGPDACWLWKGTVHKKSGYGIVGDYLAGGKRTMAHRHAYRLHYAINPGDLQVMHGCDCRRCGNPRHLSLGTPRDNWADAVQKGRQTFICPGSANGAAKLSEAEVLAIRRTAGRTSELVRQYGVTGGTIRNILQGRAWRHVTLESVEQPHRWNSLELS